MPFETMEDVTSADVAVRVTGRSTGELFMSAGEALRAIMLREPGRPAAGTELSFELRAVSTEMLLFAFLEELLFHKDADALLVIPSMVDVEQGPDGASLRCVAIAEPIDPGIHDFIVDVKAVTMHRFSVERVNGVWTATIVFDV